MSDHLEGKDWRELSEAASREQDPQKLMELIRALNQALERRERKGKDLESTPPPIRSTPMQPGDIAA